MARPHRLRDYDEYTISVINRPSVQSFLSKHSIKSLELPKIYSSPTCGVSVAGQTWITKNGESDIELSSWVLVSSTETRRVIRHEIAHILKFICKLQGGSHGKGFNRALKATCPRTWRKDKHWYPSEKIDIARKKHHPRLKDGLDNISH